jgi:cytochrome P450
MSNGMAASENFTSKFLSTQEKWRLSDDKGAYIVGILFEAGAGTTVAAMMSFILAMTLHQDSMHTLQNKIDTVVGDRIPTFEDISKLPRVRATIKEILHWRPATAGGIPHLLIKDNTYKLDSQMYFFKIDTNVYTNQWAIHRDPSLYSKGDKFILEHWLEPNI